MSPMKYTVSIAMGPIDELIGIAKTAEEVGFDSIALPDSLFYMEKAAADYPAASITKNAREAPSVHHGHFS
ncbi:hypothetical protein MSHO_04790 [Mycobacterium shottsii]|uniref:LLM class F420-dependent oxidoreductase n=1 Tax=Mycobacterium shottsii TaxID=133549 RepID=A0A7I7L5Q1_9MYCO|nr:hypothetical protein MSHO_04790 [Mycobacterium shottsii]